MDTQSTEKLMEALESITHALLRLAKAVEEGSNDIAQGAYNGLSEIARAIENRPF